VEWNGTVPHSARLGAKEDAEASCSTELVESGGTTAYPSPHQVKEKRETPFSHPTNPNPIPSQTKRKFNTGHRYFITFAKIHHLITYLPGTITILWYICHNTPPG
jgi:hypothetical protein